MLSKHFSYKRSVYSVNKPYTWNVWNKYSDKDIIYWQISIFATGLVFCLLFGCWAQLEGSTPALVAQPPSAQWTRRIANSSLTSGSHLAWRINNPPIMEQRWVLTRSNRFFFVLSRIIIVAYHILLILFCSYMSWRSATSLKMDVMQCTVMGLYRSVHKSMIIFAQADITTKKQVTDVGICQRRSKRQKTKTADALWNPEESYVPQIVDL